MNSSNDESSSVRPSKIPKLLRDEVAARGNYACEYCGIAEDLAFSAHHVDHVIAQQHGGSTTRDNLAYSCAVCNRHKGSNIASVAVDTGRVVPLFNPRTQVWSEHFACRGGRIEPLTETGRVTERLLQFNKLIRINERLQTDFKKK